MLCLGGGLSVADKSGLLLRRGGGPAGDRAVGGGRAGDRSFGGSSRGDGAGIHLLCRRGLVVIGFDGGGGSGGHCTGGLS